MQLQQLPKIKYDLNFHSGEVLLSADGGGKENTVIFAAPALRVLRQKALQQK